MNFKGMSKAVLEYSFLLVLRTNFFIIYVKLLKWRFYDDKNERKDDVAMKKEDCNSENIFIN